MHSVTCIPLLSLHLTPSFHLCLPVFRCLFMTRSTRRNAGCSFPRILHWHRQCKIHRRKGGESFLHPGLPYAECITHHVCVTLTPTARRLHTLKGHVFTLAVPFREYAFICLCVYVCGNLHGDRGHVQTQTYVHTCRSLCLHQHQLSCEGVCPYEFDSSHRGSTLVERKPSNSPSKEQ